MEAKLEIFKMYERTYMFWNVYTYIVQNIFFSDLLTQYIGYV